MAESSPRIFFARHARSCCPVSIRDVPVRDDFSRESAPCPARLDCRGDANPIPLPWRLRRLLHRAVDHLAHSRHAAGQAGRRALRATGRRSALQTVRKARTAPVLRVVAAFAGNVRNGSHAGAGLSEQPRNGHRAVRLRQPLASSLDPIRPASDFTHRSRKCRKTAAVGQLTEPFSRLPLNVFLISAPRLTNAIRPSFQNLARIRPNLANRPALAANPPPMRAATP